MAKIGKCCTCVTDCLMPFACNGWTVGTLFGFNGTVNNSNTLYDTTVACSGSSTYDIGAATGINCSGQTITLYCDGTVRHLGTIIRGSYNTWNCSSGMPSGFPNPSSGGGGSMETIKIGSQCYARFSVAVRIQWTIALKVVRRVITSGPCATAVDETNAAGLPGTFPYNATQFVQFTYSTEFLPYTVIADLQGSQTLYRSPVGSCTWSDINKPTFTCGVSSGLQIFTRPTPFPIVSSNEAAPMTLTLTLSNCLSIGSEGGGT